MDKLQEAYEALDMASHLANLEWLRGGYPDPLDTALKAAAVARGIRDALDLYYYARLLAGQVEVLS
jgi:hypothetical protein